MPSRVAARPRGSGLPRLAVVGHVNLDHHVTVPELPSRDRTVAVRNRYTLLGGTAANLARAARNAGVPVTLVSRVGPDFPPIYRRELRLAGIDLAGLETVRGASTPSCIIVHDDRGAQMTLIDQGPMGDARAAPVPTRALVRCRWLHLGTGDPRYHLRLQKWARSHSVRVALDPAQEIHYRWTAAALRRSLSDAELFFGNEAEAERAVSLLGLSDVSSLTEAVPMAIVTRGAEGADAYARGTHIHVAARRVPRVRDPTGAGDAFRGGFYAPWLGGQPLKECLDGGVRAASEWLATRHRPASRGSP